VPALHPSYERAAAESTANQNFFSDVDQDGAMDWATAASLATAAGTLVLAVATFVSVRSANRAARVAERTLLAGIRPLLVPSRPEDAEQKIGFADNRWVRVPGGQAATEVTDDAVYLVISLRNVGSGLGVLHGWRFNPSRTLAGDDKHPPVGEFRRLARDIYISGSEVGFWQGAFRDPAETDFAAARDAILARQQMAVELLYGDYEGGQRVISRFAIIPAGEDRWLASVSRHWNIDRPDPR
jgi:hypothetical protein